MEFISAYTATHYDTISGGDLIHIEQRGENAALYYDMTDATRVVMTNDLVRPLPRSAMELTV